MENSLDNTNLVYATNLQVPVFIQALGELLLSGQVITPEKLENYLIAGEILAVETENMLVPAIITRPHAGAYMAAYVSVEDDYQVVIEAHGDVREYDLNAFFDDIRATAMKVHEDPVVQEAMVATQAEPAVPPRTAMGRALGAVLGLHGLIRRDRRTH